MGPLSWLNFVDTILGHGESTKKKSGVQDLTILVFSSLLVVVSRFGTLQVA